MSAQEIEALLLAGTGLGAADPDQAAAVDQMIRLDARLTRRGWILMVPLSRYDFLVWSYPPSFVANSDTPDDVHVTFLEILMGMEDGWSVDALQIRVRLAGAEADPRRIGYRGLIPALDAIEAVRRGDPVPAALAE